MTAIFIITSNNKALQSLNLRHLVLPCTGVIDSSQLTQGGSKVRRLVNQLSWEWPVQNYVILIGISEQPDFRKIKKKKHWVDFVSLWDGYVHTSNTHL